MTESIGTARLDIVVDTSQFDSAITAAKRSVSGMSAAAQAEYSKLNAAEKRRVDSLVQQADKLGYTREQQILYNAALRNVPAAILDDLKTKLGAAATATQALAKSAGTVGTGLSTGTKSAKELQFAMRGLPAQFTDIAVSLASGQRPLMVLLQQGGQLKDMFGGIGPALRAMGGQLAALINPVTILAAGAGALAFAWNEAEDRASAFNRAIIQTGNFSGVTASALAEMASEMDNLSGVTAGSASDALAQVAASGKFAGDQILLVAQAAEQMRVATGKSIEETVAEFAKLKKDPVNAILELNDKYHFLTRAQLDHIDKLREEGREQDAVSEAFRIYADTISDRAPQIEESLGAFARLTRSIKNAALEAADAVAGMFVAGTNTDKIRALQSNIAAIESSRNSMFGGGIYGGLSDAARDKLISDFKSDIARLQEAATAGVRKVKDGSTVDTGEEIARRKAVEEFERLSLRNATDRQKLEHDIAEVRKTGLKAGKSELEIEKQVAAVRREFEERHKGRKARTVSDPTESLVGRLRQQIALNKEEAQSIDKLTTSDRLRIAIQQDLAELGGKVTAGRRELIASLLTELDATSQLAEKHKQEIKAREALAKLNEVLASSEADRQRANQAELDSFGHGERYLEQARRRLDIEQEYTRRLEDLRKTAKDKTEEQFNAEVEALQESRDRMLAVEDDFQAKWAQAQGDWTNGLNKALEDYQDNAANVAGQVADIWGNAFSGLEDVLVQFFTKGKADWRGFLDSLAADIMRFIIRQQLSKWLGNLFGGMGGGAGGGQGGGVVANMASLFSSAGYAKGGVFSGGAPIAFANGGVVGSTTLFPMANGRVGMMGEDGEEAIMPLKRGKDGKLGVAAAGGTGRIFNINIGVDGAVDRRTRQQIANDIRREVIFAERG